MNTLQCINAVAPIRVCDIGGWTDTWFAHTGAVLNIAVYPYVEVQVRVDREPEASKHVIISVENYGDEYGWILTISPTASIR